MAVLCTRALEARKAAHAARAGTASITLTYAAPHDAAAFVRQYGYKYRLN